ncbi:MAG TPA: hypothetical protein VL738_19475 [Dactylosporangium sp.]|jgi:hypothetical protein|nr:hypothetical protein [Dactylosporangium sp.]
MSRTRHSVIPMHNYVVEFRTPAGETARLEVEQTILTVRVAVGAEVPLLVRPDGKKAVFDAKDPSINVHAVARGNDAQDQERFRRLLE